MLYDRSGIYLAARFSANSGASIRHSQPASRLFEHTLEPLEDLLISPPLSRRHGRERVCVEGGGRTAVSTLFLQASKLDPCRLRTLDVWYSEDKWCLPIDKQASRMVIPETGAWLCF